MIFTNTRLIFPDGIRDGLEVVVEQGKIAAIRPPMPRLRRTGERVRGKEVIDLKGN
jgi:dihydroorotase-like cyclic amidohydrolase